MLKKFWDKFLLFFFIFSGMSAYPWVLNNPYDEPPEENARYSAFGSPPKTLDPARAYSSDELTFLEQIYEPPLQYHYLKRPYQLTPLTLESMPQVRFYNKKDQQLTEPINYSEVAYTLYDLKLKKRDLLSAPSSTG